MSKCMLKSSEKKGLETKKKPYFKFLSIPSKFFCRVFIVIKYLTTTNELSTEQ